jgi:hypothetical protein
VLRRGVVAAIALLILGVGGYWVLAWRSSIVVRENVIEGHAIAGYEERGRAFRGSSLPALDAHGFDGVQEINRAEQGN